MAEQAIEAVTCGYRNLVIGLDAYSEFDDCVVIGDQSTAKNDRDIVVGNTLFGIEIPENIRNQLSICAQQKDGLTFLVQIMAGWSQSNTMEPVPHGNTSN
jgi:hypothetical protein